MATSPRPSPWRAMCGRVSRPRTAASSRCQKCSTSNVQLTGRRGRAAMTILFRFLAALVVLITAAGAAFAEYPDRPITITVGFAPGGTSDVAARILAERLTRSLGVAVVVDN